MCVFVMCVFVSDFIFSCFFCFLSGSDESEAGDEGEAHRQLQRSLGLDRREAHDGTATGTRAATQGKRRLLARHRIVVAVA